MTGYTRGGSCGKCISITSWHWGEADKRRHLNGLAVNGTVWQRTPTLRNRQGWEKRNEFRTSRVGTKACNISMVE